MGDVYLAENMHLHRQVAIKVIRPGILSNPDARRLFLREAKAAATLDHPHILPLYDYGEAAIDGVIYPYMVMPARQEGTLKQWLKPYSDVGKSSLRDEYGPTESAAGGFKPYGGAGNLPWGTVVEMIEQAAGALQHAHDRQILHLDVKPSNFLMRYTTGQSGTPDLLLTDFGLAKIMNTEVSMTNSSRGTPSYMAPEQWRGFPVAATDQYALATMAYEMLAGRTPFQGNLQALMYQHLNTPPQPPSAFRPDLPKEVDEVLLHALAKNPADRFASVAAFANAFRQALLPEAPQPSPNLRTTSAPETPELPKPPVSAFLSPRAWLLAGLALLVVLASIVIYLLWPHPGPPASPATGSHHGTPTAHPTIAATATPIASVTPTPGPFGPLALNDPLVDNSRGYAWDEIPTGTQGGTCAFIDKAYHATDEQSSTFYGCLARNTSFSNFIYQVQMVIQAGDNGGIIFRESNNAFYTFYINTRADYTLRLYVFHQGPIGTLSSGTSPAIKIGHNQINLIMLMAQGSHITLFVNNQYVISVTDSRLSQGSIGVIAQDDFNPTHVAFTNAKVWLLSAS